MKKNRSSIRLILIIMIAASALYGCGQSGPGDSPDTAQDIGQGAAGFRLEVTDDTGTVTAWNVKTNDNETTVGAVLLSLGLIGGDMFDFGLMVTEVNGLTADFGADGAWWAFYIDGEMAVIGVDSAEIEPGITYAFVYTID